MEKNGGAIVRVGPAGWDFEDWKGLIYPERMPRSMHRLTYLAGFFDTVEINVSFYRVVPCQHCESWLRKVACNPRFKFTAKLWQRFTHERDTLPSREDIVACREGMRPLREAGKLGALLLQFPWSCRNTRENHDWVLRVTDCFSEYQLALEVRHASWDRPEVYEELAARNIAFCNIDQPLFHDSMKPMQRVTARVGYVRLHGRNYDDWFRDSAGRDDRYDYLYSEEELKPWLKRIERIGRQAEEVYVITNNHYRGQAVVNAFDLMAGMGKTEFMLPQHMVQAYPQLKKYLAAGAPREPRQEQLF